MPKKDIHPELHDVIFRDTAAEVDFVTRSTMTSDTVEEKDGKKYFIIFVDVSSASHPFFTGKRREMDTAGRIDKFRAKMAKAKK